jgi:[NiFe] hydrogenase small subunit
MDDRLPQPNEAGDVDVSRRDFLKYCSMIAAAIGLGPGMGSEVAAALTSATRPKILWLHFAECTGCTEAALRTQNTIKNLRALDIKAKEIEASTKYTRHTYFDNMTLTDNTIDYFDDLILKTVSLDYHETLMAGAGATVHDALFTAAEDNKGNFICVVEGAIPGPFQGQQDDGYFGTVGGRTMLSIAREICPKAKVIIALGACAAFGGIPYANPNPTGAKNVIAALKDLTTLPQVLNVPGCPPNPMALVGTIVYLLVKGAPPGTDAYLRPNFAYAIKVHNRCPYLPDTDLDTETSRCLRYKGCKGPGTFNICPTVQFDNNANFPMHARHVCIGCSEPSFWDTKTPFWKLMENRTPTPPTSSEIFEKTVTPVPDPKAGVLSPSKTARLQGNIKDADIKTFNALGRQVKSPLKNNPGKLKNKKTARGMLFEKTKDSVKKMLEF